MEPVEEVPLLQALMSVAHTNPRQGIDKLGVIHGRRVAGFNCGGRL